MSFRDMSASAEPVSAYLRRVQGRPDVSWEQIAGWVEDLENDLEGVRVALDWAKAPTTDEHLDGLDRVLGDGPTGYKPAGRVRALFSRERIAANRLRGERDSARQALADIQDELTNGRTANWDYIDRRFREGLTDA